MLNGLSIRAAHLYDAPKIADIHVKSWQAGYKGFVDQSYLDALDTQTRTTDWQNWLQADGMKVMLAEIAGQAVGFLSFGPVKTRFPGDKGVIAGIPGEVYALYIDPNHFRKGVGQQLLKEVPKLCKENRYGAFGLWALEKNKDAVAFYTKLGGMRSGKKAVQVGQQSLNDLAFVWRDLRTLA